MGVNEYWIVYDVTTGAARFRAQGGVGDAARQIVDEGLAVLEVPQAAVSGPEIDIAPIRHALCERIDAEAEATRHRFITPGSGQALTYQYKASEAAAYLADNSVATPFLSAEAEATGATVASLAATVLSQQAVWVVMGARIEALRMAAKANVATSEGLHELAGAASVDWESITMLPEE